MKQDKNAFEVNTQSLEEIRRLIGEEACIRASAPDSEPEEEAEPAAQQPKPKFIPMDVPLDVPLDDLPDSGDRNKKEPRGLAFEVYSVLHDIIYVLAALTIIFVFIVRLVGVDGQSMEPTLKDRDYLLLESNILYDSDDIQQGDIVVLNVPYYKDKGPIVKRVIATEGQTVAVDYENNCVWVDGTALREPYIMAEPMYELWDSDYALEYPAVVPEGCIFVLGDNRNNSSDSRFSPIGMIDERCILGKVLVLLLPGQTKDQFGNVVDPRDWSRIGKVS